MSATNSELDDILKPFHLRDAGGIKCGNAKHKAKRAILAWSEAEKKAYAAELYRGFLREFTNDHDLVNPPRWLRGVAMDEQHLLDQILEWLRNKAGITK